MTSMTMFCQSIFISQPTVRSKQCIMPRIFSRHGKKTIMAATDHDIPGDSSDPLTNLLAWAKEQGATIHPGCAISVDGASRGLVAASAIRARETLLRIPPALLFRVRDDEDPALRALLDLIPEEHWDARLAVKLLSSLSDPHWRPYLAALPPPAALPGPLFYSGATLRAAQSPALAAEVARRARFLESVAKALRCAPVESKRETDIARSSKQELAPSLPPLSLTVPANEPYNLC
jgi:hypothetical protein